MTDAKSKLFFEGEQMKVALGLMSRNDRRRAVKEIKKQIALSKNSVAVATPLAESVVSPGEGSSGDSLP